MKFTIIAKQAGRRHPIVETEPIGFEGIGAAVVLCDLLTAIVRQQVSEFNSRRGSPLLPILSSKAIDDRAATGKIGFGAIYNENRADADKAVETALQAFEDGMFAVFIDDVEMTSLDQIVQVTDGTVLTFVRLTFLAGSYW